MDENEADLMLHSLMVEKLSRILEPVEVPLPEGVTYGLEHDGRELADVAGYKRATSARISFRANGDRFSLSSTVSFGPFDDPTTTASAIVMLVDDAPRARVVFDQPCQAYTSAIAWGPVMDRWPGRDHQRDADLEQRIFEATQTWRSEDRDDCS